MSSPEGDDDDLIETQVRYIIHRETNQNQQNSRRLSRDVTRNNNNINITRSNDRPHPYRRLTDRSRPTQQHSQGLTNGPGNDEDVEIISHRRTPLAQLLEGYHSSEDDDYTDSGVGDLMEEVLAIFERTQEPENAGNEDEEVELVDSRTVHPDDELSVERVIRVLRNPRNGLSTSAGWSMLWRNMFSHPRNRFPQRLSPSDAETYEVMEVIRRSLEDDTSPRTISVKDINQKPIPTTTRPGYTRSLDEKSQNPICVKCQVELGVGQNGQEITPVAKSLSQRIFFLPCGHVYCGQCVADIRGRKAGAGTKNCCVEDCKQLLKRKGGSNFKELYFN